MSLENIISTVLHPIKWFATQKIEELATSLAVRRAIFREILRLHVSRYVQEGGRALGVDPDRARGLQEKIIDRLQTTFDWGKIDPEDEHVRAEIARAVTMAVVPTPVWVALRELRRIGPFEPKNSVVLEYRDASGSTHHSTTLIASMQQNFLFFKPFTFSGQLNSAGAPAFSGQLTGEMSRMVDERLKDEHVELLRFQVTESPPNPFTVFAQPPE